MKISITALKLTSFIFISSFLLVGCSTDVEKFTKKIAGDYQVNQQSNHEAEEENFVMTVIEVKENIITIENFANLGIDIEVYISQEETSIDHYIFFFEGIPYELNGENYLLEGLGGLHNFEEDRTSIIFTYEGISENLSIITCAGAGVME